MSGERARWRRVESLVDAAYELAPGDRERYLRKACADDEELRAEVLDLLRRGNADGPLDRPLAEVAATLTEEARSDVPGSPLAIGATLGAWRLVDTLGRGGMGRVYLAERASGDFEQRAALKVLRWELATPALVERFKNERRILAGLEHPGIARLIDGGVTADSLPYLVMEKVDGRPIDAFCRERSLPLAERLELFLQVCDAVQAAHARLVVHRDLKPSNVLVTEEGRVKLLDFGVGKILGDSAPSALELTSTQLAPMTPSYAAPEQLVGGTVSTATDIYALGAILYELLTGRRAFATEPGSPATWTRKILETDPVAPSRRLSAGAAGAGGGLRPQPLRGDLDNITLTALRKEPERRYASVDRLAADVRRYLAGDPVDASPDTFRYRAGKFVRRNRAGVIAAALVAAATVAGLAGTTWQARAARAEAEKAERTVEFLAGVLTDANLQSDTAGDRTLDALLARADDRVDGELADHPAVRARVRLLLAEAFSGIGDLRRADELYGVALRESEAAFGPDSSEVGWALARSATDSHEGDATESQIERLRRALAIMERNHGRRSEAYVEVANLLGEAHSARGEEPRAEARFREALEIAEGVYGASHQWIAITLANLGRSLQGQGWVVESVEYRRRALAMYVETVGEDAAAAITLRNNLAYSLHDLGRYGEAEREYRRAIELSRAKLGEDHPTVAESLTNLGRLLMDQGRFAQAAGPVEEAATILSRTLGEGHFSRVASEINLGSLLFELGRLEEAEALYAGAAARFEQTLGPDHVATIRVGWLLGRLHFVRGATDDAGRLFGRRPSASQMSEENVNYAELFLGVGRIAAGRGAIEEAERSCRKALEILTTHLAPEHWRIAEVEAELAMLEARRGDDLERLRAARERLRAALPDDNWRLRRVDRVLATPI